MSKPCFKAFLTGIFLLLPTFALADVTTDQDAPNTPQPFSFYCEPYKLPFEESKHYIVKPVGRADNLATCYYTIPQTAPLKFIGIYKGTVGSSTQVSNDLTIFNPKSSLRTFPNVFHEPQNEDQFFTVAFSAATGPEIMAGDTYFQTGVGSPPADATILNWKWGPKPASEFDPVIIIPGILGSWEKNGELTLDPIGHIYNNLVDTFIASGYVKDQTLFEFPYEWRNSNIITAELLEEKIQEVKNSCNCGQIDLVTHSMGGLVAAQYLKKTTSTSVDQIFYIGTPFLGATYSYKIWEGGEIDFVNPFKTFIAKRIFNREARDNGFDNVSAYLHENPIFSVRELLPIYAYLNTSPQYPNGYPRNVFLEQLNSNESSTKIFNAARSYVVIGDTGVSSTTKSFTVQQSTQPPLWEHGEPIAIQPGRGDGTVLEESATAIFLPNLRFNNTDHNQIVSKSSSYVFETLNNRTPDTVINKIYDGFFDADVDVVVHYTAPSAGDFRVSLETMQDLLKSASTQVLERRALVIFIYSPIDVQVTAPDGKIIGTDISNGSIVNQIPGATYSGPDAEHEYVLIPNPSPGEYKVDTKGTGSGPYTIATGYVDLATTSLSLVSGTTTQGEIINNSLSLSSTTVKITRVETSTPTLEELLAQLKVKIQSLDIKKQLKDNLLKKVEKIEKKIEKQKKKKATQTVVNLEQKILKKGQKGKLTDADVQEILDLLDQIEKAL